MIKEVKGDIFQSRCDLITITTNCQGAMGRGLAWVIRDRYPELYHRYRSLCLRGLIRPGKLMTMTSETDGCSFLFFPTKDEWVNDTKEEYLHLGLQTLVKQYKSKGIRSLAMTLLGSKNGNLRPEVSRRIIYAYLEPITDLHVDLYTR